MTEWRSMHKIARLSILLVLALGCSTVSSGESDPKGVGDKVTESASQIEARGINAMQAREWSRAADIWGVLIQQRPNSFVGHYNLAAALSRLGDLDGSQESLTRAIALGFADKSQLQRDPDLSKLRETEYFRKIMTQWDATIQTRRNIDLARMNELVKHKNMEHRTLEDLRLEVVSAHDPVSTDQAVEELELITNWTMREVFKGLDSTLGAGGGEDTPWVMVGLPERRGFAKWALETFGASVRGSISSVGGAYEHQQRRLVAQDLGATLRHEYVHVLHWRDMSRIGQEHAPWIQEGLASVVEDFDVVGGRLVPVASWRTNMVKRLQRVRKLPSIETIARMDLKTFTNRKPLARYAQARTILMWLHDQRKLSDFYAEYTKSYSMDPSGLLALERVLGIEIDEINKRYRVWVADLDEVAETGSDLDATLGISVENGTGDGVVITELTPEARRRSGLRLGSVITGINGRPARDLHELIRQLGRYKAGDTVQVRWRRGTIHGENAVELVGR
jgi:PDZ domain